MAYTLTKRLEKFEKKGYKFEGIVGGKEIYSKKVKGIMTYFTLDNKTKRLKFYATGLY